MSSTSTRYRGAEIAFEVRSPEEGCFYAVGTAIPKDAASLHVFSGKCRTYAEAEAKLLAYAYKLIDEVHSG
ncbi:MAG: hypothetical protein LBE51_08720 [Acidovorax sp.]|jgi:hypothetical protein|nr:hypothetical protein [Acidovorax sp.]